LRREGAFGSKAVIDRTWISMSTGERAGALATTGDVWKAKAPANNVATARRLGRLSLFAVGPVSLVISGCGLEFHEPHQPKSNGQCRL